MVSCDVNAQTWPFARELLAWAGVGSAGLARKRSQSDYVGAEIITNTIFGGSLL